jgi:UPF0755 protein
VTHQNITESIFGEEERTRAPVVRSRREIHQRRRRRRRRGPRRFAVLLVVALLVGGGGYLAWGALAPAVSDLIGGGSEEAVDFAGPGSGAVDVVVEPGDSGEEIATALRDAGVGVPDPGRQLRDAHGDDGRRRLPSAHRPGQPHGGGHRRP